jgi:hypothetical protein
MFGNVAPQNLDVELPYSAVWATGESEIGCV